MNFENFTALFDNPKVSIFDRSQSKDFNLNIGKWIPAYWDLISFGNSTKGNSGHALRLAPLLAPNFSNLRLQEHTSVVPLRVIIEDYEKTFNYAENRDGASLPHFDSNFYHQILQRLLQAGYPIIGTLLDFLGYPTYCDLYDVTVANMPNFIWQRVSDSSVTLTYGNLGKISSYIGSGQRIEWIFLADVPYRDEDISFNTAQDGTEWVMPLVHFAARPNDYASYVSFNDLEQFFKKIDGAFNSNGTLSTTYVLSIEDVVKASKYETVESLVSAYMNYVFGRFLFEFLKSNVDFTDEQPVYSTLPLRAYYRTHFDYNVNGNFFDRDSALDLVYNLELRVMQMSTEEMHEFFTVKNRLWDSDMVTDLLPTAAADDAIEIPANSTVLDLAKLTAIQKLVLKLSYSKRYRDVVWNIFKIKPSDARLQQSSIIRQKTHFLGIGETVQTSQTSVTSVLGSYAGRGYSAGKNSGYHIFCEEPCVVINFISLVPKAVYADAIHPLIHVDDIFDFPLPDMDVLGNQPVYSDLLTGNVLDTSIVLGYGRQYLPWTQFVDTVHGNFKTDLNYWQLTRRFYSTPVINEDFLRINDADDFDRIFSVPNAPHAFCSIFYDVKTTRHMSRSVRIKI